MIFAIFAAMKQVLTALSSLYSDEGFTLSDSGNELDLRELDGTNSYCSEESVSAIRQALSPFGPEGLHWIDSGDYHYMSAFFLEKIREPFRLVLIDHHNDAAQVSDGILSCGNWVQWCRERLPMMTADNWYDSYDGSLQSTPDALPCYLSIDIDALSREFASTNWDQGEMTLPRLEKLISDLHSASRLIGTDVCGGLTVSKGAFPEDLTLNLQLRERLQTILTRYE